MRLIFENPLPYRDASAQIVVSASYRTLGPYIIGLRKGMKSQYTGIINRWRGPCDGLNTSSCNIHFGWILMMTWKCDITTWDLKSSHVTLRGCASAYSCGLEKMMCCQKTRAVLGSLFELKANHLYYLNMYLGLLMSEIFMPKTRRKSMRLIISSHTSWH